MYPTQTLAIDYNVTIVENSFTSIGKTKLNVFKILEKFQEPEYTLLLYTLRSGTLLRKVLTFCNKT